MGSTLLWIWMVSRTIVDYTEIGRIIGGLFYTVQGLLVLGTNNNEIITSHFHISLALYPESNYHVRMCDSVHRNMLSLSSKKKSSGKVSLKTSIIGFNNEMTINTLMIRK